MPTTAASLNLSMRAWIPTTCSKWATMDKGYDADRIRERLSCDGVQAVIPPIPTRARKLPYDHARYRERNRIERFFNKVKHFRRIATRYDKLASQPFASPRALAAVVAAVSSADRQCSATEAG